MNGNEASGALIEADAPSARMGSVRWTICAMLFAATTINYMDRQVIALLKPTLEHSIGMTELDYGYIVDAFQLAYALGLLVAGRFVDKVGTRIGYMVIMAIWSLSAMGHALANNVLEFGIARFSLGLGESGNFPAAIKTMAEWFPQSERSLATGIFNSGANVGAILAPLIVPLVTIHFGWHAAFLVTGIFSAMWIVLWFFNYRKPTEHPRLTDRGTGLHQRRTKQMEAPPLPRRGSSCSAIARPGRFPSPNFSPTPSGGSISSGCLRISAQKFHLDLSHLGLPLIIVYNASAVGSIGGGWLPAPFRRLGFSPEKARLAAMTCCACAVVPIFLVNYLSAEWVAIALLSLAAASHQGWSANLFTTTSDMFPRSAVGSVTGIGGMAGSVGGFLLATFAGYILQMTHSYASLFAIAASAYLTALAVLRLLAPGLKRVELTA